jgi:hypothetical protein
LPQKILIFKGALVFQTFKSHLFGKPEKVNSLYKEEVEKTLVFSKTHLIESFSWVRLTVCIKSCISENSASSLRPKFLLKVKAKFS